MHLFQTKLILKHLSFKKCLENVFVNSKKMKKCIKWFDQIKILKYIIFINSNMVLFQN